MKQLRIGFTRTKYKVGDSDGTVVQYWSQLMHFVTMELGFWSLLLD